MRPTRLGWGWLFATALTLFTAGSTSNNLLYLVYSMLLGGICLAAVVGRLNLLGIRATAAKADLAFKSEPCSLPLRLSNTGRWSAYAVEVLWQGTSSFIESLAPGESAEARVRGALPHRGLNSLDDLVIESSFPLNIFRFRRRAPSLTLTCVPPPKPIREPREVAAQARASGRPALRKGAGEELYGLREYAPGDDVRLLNWKMSARLGRSVVNEYCDSRDDRVTVTVARAGEEEIEGAASACRFYVDAGAQVRLESPERTVDFGRGLGHLDKLLTALALLGEGSTPRSSGPAPRLRPPPPQDTIEARRLLLLCGMVAYAGLFLIDEVSVTLLTLLSPLLAAAVYAQERRKHFLPAGVWTALSLIVLAHTGLIEWRTAGVAVANVHLMLYLLLNRLLNPFKAGEFGQVMLILFLAFFLTSGLTISPWYFLLLIGFGAAAAGWLTVSLGLTWRGRRAWRSAWAGSILAGALASALLFALTPRVEGLRRMNPFVNAGLDKLSVPEAAVTGFTEHISLGFYGRLRKSSARVMRVKPLPAPREEFPGPIYVRGASFDLFDGVRWSKSRVAARRAPFTAGRMVFPASAPPPRHVVYDLTIYPMATSVAFTIGTPWMIDHSPQPASFDHTDTIRFAGLYSSGIHYQVHSSPDGGFTTSDPAMFLQVPPDPTRRVAALAREAAGAAADAPSQAVAVRDFLRQRYSYSLYSDGQGKGLEDFLFSSRKGNCEYFATAAAILLRHLGVPTRLVSGFLADDWNDLSKFYDVRQAEAHAWVETFVPGRGWMRLDPTPPAGAWAAQAEAVGRRLERLFQTFEQAWYRHVIGYDQYVQRAAFRRWSRALSPQALWSYAKRLQGPAAVVLAAGLIAFAARRLRAWLRAPKPTLFSLAQAALARAGFRREAFMTAREFAAAVAAKRPDLALVAGLAEFDDAERFRPGGATAEERARAAGSLAALLHLLRR